MRFAPDAFVITDSVAAYNDLAQDLTNPESSLSSSLGMVIGTAEGGETFTSKRFAALNPNAVYVLYIGGSSITQVLRDMCYELSATRPHCFKPQTGSSGFSALKTVLWQFYNIATLSCLPNTDATF